MTQATFNRSDDLYTLFELQKNETMIGISVPYRSTNSQDVSAWAYPARTTSKVRSTKRAKCSAKNLILRVVCHQRNERVECLCEPIASTWCVTTNASHKQPYWPWQSLMTSSLCWNARFPRRIYLAAKGKTRTSEKTTMKHQRNPPLGSTRSQMRPNNQKTTNQQQLLRHPEAAYRRQRQR